MSSRKEGRRHKSDSEFDDLVYEYYKDLRDGRDKVKVKDNIYECPYCGEHEKQEYAFREILRHANRIGRESTSARSRDRARHLGLERYLAELVDVVKDGGRDNRSSEPEGRDELIVCPWMAIVANIPVELKDGRYVGDSGRKLRDEWVLQGYNPIKVHPLWNYRGHTGFAIVEFTKDWAGFANAMTFANTFEKDNHGKRDWYRDSHGKRDSYGAKKKGGKLYVWIARDEEYNRNDNIGEYLRKNADLKTISEIEVETKRRDTKLVCDLTNELEVKDKQCEEIKTRISKTEGKIANVMAQQDKMVQEYNEGITV